MVKVGGNVKSRFEDALRYYDFKEKGCEILVDQICFLTHGTDTVDLVREALREQTCIIKSFPFLEGGREG